MGLVQCLGTGRLHQNLKKLELKNQLNKNYIQNTNWKLALNISP
jgi:hypothetical protein